jgi:hypothetical protein
MNMDLPSRGNSGGYLDIRLQSHPETRIEQIQAMLVDSRCWEIRHIAREHPGIFKRLNAGDYVSVRLAAIEAGFSKAEFEIPDDPVEAARIIAMYFQHDDQLTILRNLAEHVGWKVHNNPHAASGFTLECVPHSDVLALVRELARHEDDSSKEQP